MPCSDLRTCTSTTPVSRGAGNPVHAALTRLQYGDLLHAVPMGERVALLDADNCPVAQLSSAASRTWSTQFTSIVEIRVICLIARLATDGVDDQYRTSLNVPQWYIPVCEIVTRGG